MEKQMKLMKVVVIGPESTGKSTLCRELAAHYNSYWVPEYAREYLLANGKEYTYEDLSEIAAGQAALEDDIIGALSLRGLQQRRGKLPVFIDTDLYVIKVWSEFVFNKCDNRILNGIAGRECDLYLLCGTDLPWVKDELREYPDLATREKLYHYYKDALVNQYKPWVEICGNVDERLRKAIRSINLLLE